jgi:hypothetical protein
MKRGRKKETPHEEPKVKLCRNCTVPYLKCEGCTWPLYCPKLGRIVFADTYDYECKEKNGHEAFVPNQPGLAAKTSWHNPNKRV